MVYVLLAYLVLPALWTRHEHQPGLAERPMVTRTAQGIPGDPLNVGLVGSREEVVRAMRAADWYPADATTLRTAIEIAGSVLFDRPYRDAPVSDLYYDGRRQDLAFEKPAGTSADERHHVRFWRVLERGSEGRPVWLGAATFDRGVGFSHLTGAVTHHIAPDIDAERDGIIGSLDGAQVLTARYQTDGGGADAQRTQRRRRSVLHRRRDHHRRDQRRDIPVTRPLLVVDGDSFAHRSFHALPKTIRRRGDKGGGAIVGFANFLLRLYDNERPRAVLVGWDTLDQPTYRHQAFPAYQSGREFDPELLDQLDVLPELVAACGFANAKAAGYEADDFLAAAVAEEERRGG